MSQPSPTPHVQLDLEHFLPYRLSVLSNRTSNAIARARTGRLFARVRVRDVLRPAAIAPDTASVAQLPPTADVVVGDRGFHALTEAVEADAGA